MTDKLTEIAERHARATPGEWTKRDWDFWRNAAVVVLPSGDVWKSPGGSVFRIRDLADADFIAHAHQDIPYLLDLAKSQADEIARLTLALSDAEARGKLEGLEEAAKWHDTEEAMYLNFARDMEVKQFLTRANESYISAGSHDRSAKAIRALKRKPQP